MAQGSEVLLTPREVASLFRVDSKTVSRWAATGKLSSVRTLGGHRRKTGKRVTVYLELSDDATIKSNRVTIQAN